VANPVVDLPLGDLGQVKRRSVSLTASAISGAVATSVPSRSNMMRSKELFMARSDLVAGQSWQARHKAFFLRSIIRQIKGVKMSCMASQPVPSLSFQRVFLIH
jgi:hypothetical protein